MSLGPGRPCREAVAWGTLFGVITLAMLGGLLASIDDGTLRFIGESRSDTLTTIMRAATTLGDGAVEVPIAFGLMAVLWRLAGRLVAWRYFLCGVSGEIVYVVAKAAVQRPRPDIIPRLGSAGWHSYPSGHAMLAPIIYSTALLLIATRVESRAVRAALAGGAIVIPLAIAMSRVYLGVHYPSDVLGALSLGAAWGYLWFGGASSIRSTSALPAAR